MAANLRVRMRDLKMAAMLRLRSFCLVRSGVLNRFSLLHSAVQRPVALIASQKLPIQSRTSASTANEKSAVGHWTLERIVTVSQLGLIGAAFTIGPNPVSDWGLAVLLPLHTYWGIEQVIHDYVPEAMRVFYKTGSAPETARKIVHWLWVGTSLLTFVGLCYVNIYDVGLCKAVQTLWTKI